MKKEFISYLNVTGPPEHDHPDNGGRVPYNMVDYYGVWLELNDPIAFNVGLNEFENEKV